LRSVFRRIEEMKALGIRQLGKDVVSKKSQSYLLVAPCRHCGDVRKIYGRGLCGRCWQDKEVRARYPKGATGRRETA
jgi:hypothetical protein